YFSLAIFLFMFFNIYFFFFSSRRRHTRSKRDWSSDVCSSDLDRRNIKYFENLLDINSGFFSRQFFSQQIKNGCYCRAANPSFYRSEERRVGKECRSRWSRCQ